MNDVLNELKLRLNSLNLFKNIKVGIEKGISSKDVPFARVVPTNLMDDSKYSNLKFYIYIGIKKSANSEENYTEIINLSKQVIKLLNKTELNQGLLKFNEMQFDEDKLDNLKVSALSFSLDSFK